jgi:putative ABC transport system permease protein
MLVGDRGKYFGIVAGLTFASLLITLFVAIFLGLMSRTYAPLTDAAIVDVWVMDPQVEYLDDVVGLREGELARIRGLQGVEWAVPYFRGVVKLRLPNGDFQTCTLVGVDDASLAAAPPAMAEGAPGDLRRADSIVVDAREAGRKLSLKALRPGDEQRPLRTGDVVEVNDQRAVVAGLARVSSAFSTAPTIYTTYRRALQYAPPERKQMTFVLVRGKPGQDPAALARRVSAETGLGAHTREEFSWMAVRYVLSSTGIAQNFGITVALGFIIGLAIAGQAFFTFTQDNLRYFGALKAMGASNFTVVRMVALQALTVGGIGYGLGVGVAAGIGYLARDSELSFRLPFELLAVAGAAIAVISLMTSLHSVWKVLRLEPGIVFKS